MGSEGGEREGDNSTGPSSHAQYSALVGVKDLLAASDAVCEAERGLSQGSARRLQEAEAEA